MSTLRLAFRQLAKSPGFAAIAILTLALGIGFSASTFSAANAFLLRNVPYPEADQLVRVFATSRQTPRGAHAPGNAIAVRETATSFAGIEFTTGDLYALGEPGQPAERVGTLVATAGFFNVLGVQPSLGRGFAPDDDAPEKPKVAVITDRAWSRRYAADPAIIGRSVRLNGEQYTVVGVLPPSFEAPLVWGPVEFIVPRTLHPEFRQARADGWMDIIARLKPGVSARQAQSELATIAKQLEAAYPKENAGRGLSVVGLAQSNMDSVSRSLLWLMTGISLAMLLIACANLASLQVARAFGRSREFAVRAALGGSRRQLMAPLLAESLVLAVIGGVAGLMVASWCNDLFSRMLIINNEPGFALPIDGRVLLFAAASSLLSGLAFGLAPAWLASRSPAAESLKEGSRSSTAGRSHQRLKHALIVCELALALALVGGAAAFGVGARSFIYRELGWRMDGLFVGYLALPYNQYGEDARSREFYRALLPKLAAIPAVEHAVICRNLPLGGIGPLMPLTVEGQPVEDQVRQPLVEVDSVSAEFFSALEIPVKQGEVFSDRLTEKDRAVAVINEPFAQRYWPGDRAIGRRIRIADGPWLEVVAVVGDVRMAGRLTASPTPLQVYVPLVQSTSRYVTLALRTSVTPESVTRAVREAVASIDPDVPVAQPGSVRGSMERNLSNLNVVIVNLAISAGMGLLIAAVGLFGVISQLTAQRTRDIGVRIALGAAHSDILRLIVGEGARLMIVGLSIGVLGYFGLTTLLRSAMPAMDLPGWWLLVANVTVLAFTMLFACWLPAHRATRINPVDALRAD